MAVFAAWKKNLESEKNYDVHKNAEGVNPVKKGYYNSQ
jgi:hypothetical protein